MSAPEQGPAVGPQVIFGFDSSGLCTLSTGAGLVDLGLRPGQLVGQNLFEVYENDPSALAALRRVLAGETFSTEREFDGRILSVYYEPVRDVDGTVTGALGVSTDVTEQRRIEREVRASRERARLLADLSTALTREVLDLEALLRVAVRSVTEAVADVGAIWLYSPARDRLDLRAVWRMPPDSRRSSNGRAPSAPHRMAAVDVADADALSGARIIDLAAAGDAGFAGDELLTRWSKRFGLQTDLRVPLHSRGLLLGVLDVARGSLRGAFTDEDISLVTDIAERCALALDNSLLLEAHKQSREELVKFQALADASGDLIAISDNDGHWLHVNPRIHEYGVELVEDDAWSTIDTHVGPSAADAMRSALEAAGRWSGDLTASISGEELIVHGDVFRLSHPDTGAALGTAWIGQDVTEIRATEAAFRGANADLKQFKALVEASPDFIAIAGLDGKVKYVNPPGRELIGMDPAIDVTTTTISDYLTPEGLVASEQIEQPAVIANGHWEGESTLRNHRGPPIPVAIASFLIRDAATGEPFALATVQRDITERLAAETALRELVDQREALLTRLVDAQDAERTQIAADVHDDPVQALAAVDLRLGLLRRQLREQAPQLLDTLEPLQASVTGATDRLRALLFDLEPPDLEHGLAAALLRAAEEIFENTATSWSVDGAEEPDVPDATRAIAYRIGKEAMINARKHASARNVSVSVAGREGGLVVSIADDGVGLGPEPIEPTPGHRGLFSMRDRAAVAGGWCSLRNRRGGGTRVTVWLPGPSPR
ncbi:MAG TPA: PAS domain S-box protein [Nocardioidaceae bacterium]|nr:PAS domain S-box protein [Nocardioidaceae bacterium]